MRLSAIVALTLALILCAPGVRAAENDPSVTTYHADAARSGHYVVPGLTWARAANMQRDSAFDGHVPGNVYAQPLYWRPPGSEHGQVIVATEDNVVVALDSITEARSGSAASGRRWDAQSFLSATSTRSGSPAPLSSTSAAARCTLTP